MPDPHLLALLPPDRRLALAYAPRATKALFLGLFALDARLAAIVGSAREPLLAQMKLAWWREQLGKPLEQRATGEPLLAALAPWDAAGSELAVLADGWESLLGDEQNDAARHLAFAQARGQALASMASLVGGNPDEARRAAECWALADLMEHAASQGGQSLVNQSETGAPAKRPALGPSMRPLLVLWGLSRRSLNRAGAAQGTGGLLLAMRLGMLGI
ncbi:MAG: hypothetical protein ABL914_10410 [Novosphingobium sp.]|uniref:hypothetical protein n=1 Tax=Novosphingobium sp. TaxID=1874826 RepID=UPI0032BA9E13